VTAEAFESLCGQIVELLAEGKPLDGVMLALHGAMVSEKFADADGEIVRRLREALGISFPLVVTLDYHTNVSERIVKDSTALVIYKTYPHVDQRERGLQAAEILAIRLEGRLNRPKACRSRRCCSTSFIRTQPSTRCEALWQWREIWSATLVSWP